MSKKTKSEPRRIRLTKTVIAGLPVPCRPDGKPCRQYHLDSGQDGLSVCVTSTGTRTFYRTGRIGGRPQRIPIGRVADVGLAEARRIVRKMNGQIASGGNPHEDRQDKKSEPTVADLWRCWWAYAMEHKRPKSRSEDQRMFKTFLECWAGRKLSTIRRRDVAGLHRDVGESNGKYTANRLLSLLSAAWNEGRRADLHELPNPTVGVRRFEEVKRDRWLDAEELRRLLEVLSRATPDVRDFFLLCLFTGSRRGNVQSMRWADVDLEFCTWTIPAADAKAGEAIVIPLVLPALGILRERLEHSNGSPFVFPGRGKTGHMMEPKKAWGQVRKEAGIPDIRLHDLRRTMGSWLAEAGTSLQVIGKALGHRDLKSTEVYSRLSVDPVREAMGRAVGRMLESDKEGEK